LQWLQDQSEINGNNRNNIKLENSRHFWKKRKYLKNKIGDLERRVKPRTLEISIEE
jgi:hypothetical protein